MIGRINVPGPFDNKEVSSRSVGSLSLQPRRVSREEKELLTLGDLVIQQVKSSIPYAMNRASDINQPNEANLLDAFWRGREAVVDCPSHLGKLGKNSMQNFCHVSAQILEKVGVGNCFERSVFVAHRMIQVLPPTARICIVNNEEVGHQYVLVTSGPCRPVVIDAWPPKAQAVLFDDYFLAESGDFPFDRNIEMSCPGDKASDEEELEKFLNDNDDWVERQANALLLTAESKVGELKKQGALNFAERKPNAFNSTLYCAVQCCPLIYEV